MDTTQTITLLIVLMAAAYALIFLEFVVPSFGILSALAAIAAVVSVYVGYLLSPGVAVAVGIALVLSIPSYIFMLTRILPKTRFGRRLYLDKSSAVDGVGMPLADQYKALVGKIGTAYTPLRPIGTIRVEGQRISARAETGMIDRGATVKIVAADAMNVIVRRSDATAATDAAKSI